MKKNLFYNIIKSWKDLSYKEKLDLLQEFENLNAIFEGRKAREIILNNKNSSFGVNAEYSFDEPTIITLNHIDTNPLEMANSVFHEGFHALCDDYFNGKTNLKTFSEIDKRQMLDERRKIDLIYNRAFNEGMLNLFALSYYEEKLVRKETCLYLIYNLINCCENLEDCEMVLGLYHKDILGSYYSYEKYRKDIDIQYGGNSYEKLLSRIEQFDKKIFSHKLRDISTDKEDSRYSQSGIIVENFEKGLMLLSSFQNGKRSQQEYVNEQLNNLKQSQMLLE